MVRRHHLTLLSACVLGAALTIALTSTSFELDQPQAAQATEPGSEAPVAAAPVAPTPTRYQPPRTRLVVYYVIDSEEQRHGIVSAVQADIVSQEVGGIAQQSTTYRDFVWARTEEEEAAARDFLEEISILSQLQDYQFRVVDLR